jgi:hypothetical protein
MQGCEQGRWAGGAANPVITMGWQGAADNSGGMGLAGYSYLFDTAPDTVPDTVIDLPHQGGGIHNASSATLAAGTYYFHLATCDLADNTEGKGGWRSVSGANCTTVHTGPYIIVADAPPTVVNVLSVAATWNYFLDPNERTSEAITHLAVLFSELVDDSGGGTAPGDVTNPTSYLLVEAGADGVIDTASCGPAQDDDQQVTIDSVAYSPPAAAIMTNGGMSLPAGSYRLLVCAVIHDMSGNPLDGNDDGTGGDDFTIDFKVINTNILANSNFDAGLGGWSTEVVAPSFFDYSLTDADDAPSSGSAFITNQSAADPGFELHQCVDISGISGAFDLSGWIRLVANGTGIPTAQARVEFYTAAACAGTPAAIDNSPRAPAGSAGQWLQVGMLGINPPPGALSARVAFTVASEEYPTDPFDAYFDVLTFSHPTLLIFSGTFESGDTSAWSSTVNK